MDYTGTFYGALERKNLHGINYCIERAAAGTQQGCMGERKVVQYGDETLGLDYVMEKVRAIYAELSRKDLTPIAEDNLKNMKLKAERFEEALSGVHLEGPPPSKEEPSFLQLLIQLVESIYHQLMHVLCGQ